jgi:hypothetical protein
LGEGKVKYMDFDKIKELMIGRKIIKVIEDKDRLYPDSPCIDEIILDNGIHIEFLGQADRTMVYINKE